MQAAKMDLECISNCHKLFLDTCLIPYVNIPQALPSLHFSDDATHNSILHCLIGIDRFSFL